MNQNQPFPEDRESPAGDSADTQRLAQLEQRLRNARPRPAELDVEAIVRAASVADQMAELPDRSVTQRGTRSYTWISAIAGAWVCGAIAGALLTFVLLKQDVSPKPPSERIAASKEQTPKVTEPVKEDETDDDTLAVSRDDTPPEANQQWSPAESPDFVALLAPYTRETGPFGDGRMTLRAGALARGPRASRRLDSPNWTDPTSRNQAVVPTADSEAKRGIPPDFVPDIPITRGQLLRELLGTSPESVL